MGILIGISKVLLSFLLGLIFMGVFLCFGGTDIDNMDNWYFVFCTIIGIGMFIIGLCALFGN